MNSMRGVYVGIIARLGVELRCKNPGHFLRLGSIKFEIAYIFNMMKKLMRYCLIFKFRIKDNDLLCLFSIFAYPHKVFILNWFFVDYLKTKFCSNIFGIFGIRGTGYGVRESIIYISPETRMPFPVSLF